MTDQAEPTLLKPFEVIRDNKRYVYDPETMTVAQWEAAEKEIIEARYYDLMNEHYAYCKRPEHQIITFDPSIPDQRAAFERIVGDYALAQMTNEAEHSPAMKGAVDYFARRIKREEHYAKVLRNFHENLVSSGGRLRLVEALLIEHGTSPADATKWKQMKAEIREKIIPVLKRAEVEQIIQNFMNCSEFVEHLSLSYLRAPGA